MVAGRGIGTAQVLLVTEELKEGKFGSSASGLRNKAN
jgi:hypothetical protein